jgi:hypothetical protein
MEDASLEGMSTKKLLELLDSARHDYGRAAASQKLGLLRALGTRQIRQAALLKKYHEALCFLQAYPDSRELLALVDDALDGFAGLVEDVNRHTTARNRKQLDDTGIAGTSIHYPFSYGTAEWLARRFPHDVSVDWDEFEKEDKLLVLLAQFVAYLENEAIDDQELETRRWLTLGQKGKTDLTALLQVLDGSGLRQQVRDALYEQLDLPLCWQLRSRSASRTTARIRPAEVFYQTRPLSRRKEGVARLIKKPLTGVCRPGRSEAERLIDASRAALGVRLREIFPLLYANPQDAWAVDVGRGVRIVLIGMRPARRMPLECTYFFLLLRNGVPLGYGCGSTFADRCEVAANVFDSFRGGESAFIYAQVLRAFYHVFGATSFLLDKSQIGSDGGEGIKSGAFWFYHKMGFRPVAEEAARLAEGEVVRMQQDRRYRSPAAVLRRLAQSDMMLNLGRTEPAAGRIRLGNIGRLVTAAVGSDYGGRRTAAVRSAMDKLARVLPLRPLGRFTRDELEAIRRFSPLVAQIPDLNAWTPGQKADVVSLMAAKGSASEVPYARQFARHTRFLKALAALSERGGAL